MLRHILTAKNLLSNPIFKFPNCLPFLSTVCCICRQFVGENLCSFADSPSLFEMWFHFLQLRSALNISSALRQVVHGTRWHAKRKSYKVLFWREITPLAVPIFMENACVLLMGVLSTFLVSWLGKDAMAGVGLADSFNMVIMAFFAAIDLGTTVVAGDATTEVKALALTYLELTALSYPAAAITLIGSGALRGAGNTKIPLLINGSLNILNIIISGILIYGLFSWPGLGFVG
ncbi:FMN/FAD transporter, partial [Escherichia coli]